MMVGCLVSVLYKDGPSALCITTRLGENDKISGRLPGDCFFFLLLLKWAVFCELESEK